MSAMPATADTPLPPFVVECRESLRSSYDELRNRTRAYAADRTPGSTFMVEERQLTAMGRFSRPRQQLWRRGLETVQITTAAAEDHIFSTIARLAGPDIPLFAHTTLARAGCEAAARVAYLLDADISVQERLLRFGASLHHAMTDQLKGAKQLPEDTFRAKPMLVTAAEQRLKDLDAHLDACGMEVRDKGRGSRLFLRPNGPDTLLAPQISALAQGAFAHRPTWYRAFSGTAHGLEWALSASAPAIGPDGDMEIRPNLVDLGGAVLLELDAISLLDRRFARFFGHDPEPASHQYQERVDAVDKGMLKLGINQG